MIKSFLSVLFLLLFSIVSKSQSTTEAFTEYSQPVFLDTTIAPDHFLIQVSVAEYRKHTFKRRKHNFHTVSLDTIDIAVRHLLDSIGIKAKVERNKIIEAEDLYNRLPSGLFQASYSFTIVNKDQIDQVFKGFQLHFPKNFTGMYVKPVVSEESFEKLKQAAEKKLSHKAYVQAEEFAKKNKLKIVRNSKYIFTFSLNQTGIDPTFNMYGQLNRFNINFSNPIYSAYLNCDYLME